MRKPKPSLQDTMEANAKAMRGLMALSGRQMPAELEAPVREAKKPRAAPTKSDENNLEAAVMREVGQVILSHPKVMFAVRQNSGSVQMELKGGEVAPVWFYRWIKRKSDMTITDFWGMLVDGRIFAIECKERNWKVSGDHTKKGRRESKQRNFILTVQDAGGIGGFATCAEDAIKCLSA